MLRKLSYCKSKRKKRCLVIEQFCEFFLKIQNKFDYNIWERKIKAVNHSTLRDVWNDAVNLFNDNLFSNPLDYVRTEEKRKKKKWF